MPANNVQPAPFAAAAQVAPRFLLLSSDGAPLHAAKADAPDRHDRLAQRRSSQRRLRPGASWTSAVCRHGPASTASTKASTLLKASHEAEEVLAGVKAVPIGCWSDGCWR